MTPEAINGLWFGGGWAAGWLALYALWRYNEAQEAKA